MSSSVARNDAVYQRIQGEVDNISPISVKWHSSCHAVYSSKRNVQYTNPEMVKDDSSKIEPTHVKCTNRSKLSTIDWTKCLFCKNRTYKGNVEMSFVSTEVVRGTILNAASRKDDDEMCITLDKSVNELVTLGVRYHKNCLTLYGQKTSKREVIPPSIHELAFGTLVEKIGPEIELGRALQMSDILSQYKRLLPLNAGADQYTTHKLKARLQNYYGLGITFHQPSNQQLSELVYSNNVSIGDVINVAWAKSQDSHNAQSASVGSEDDDEDDDDDDAKLLYRAATLLSGTICKTSGINIRPLDTNNLTKSSARSIVPDKLYMFLRWLVTKESSVDFVTPQCSSSVDEMRVMVLAQDMVYVMSHGKIRTPKHISLAMSVRHISGSKQVINLLHRAGNSVSYDDCECIDTSMANEILANTQDGVTVPSNITPGTFVQLGADNNDINEETLNGKSTTHSTTMVVYQRCSFGPIPPRTTKMDHRVRKRSMQPTDCFSMYEIVMFGRRPKV